MEARRGTQKLSQPYAGRQKVLEVVKDQKQMLVAQDGGERIEAPRALSQSHSLADEGYDERRIIDRRQLHEDCTGSKGMLHLRGHLDRQSSLSHPSHTGYG